MLDVNVLVVELPNTVDGSVFVVSPPPKAETAILTPCRPTRDVCNKTLEAAIDFAVRVPNRCSHLRKCLRHLRLALHDKDAVGNEPKVLPHRLKLILQVRRMLWAKRLNPR